MAKRFTTVALTFVRLIDDQEKNILVSSKCIFLGDKDGVDSYTE
jgi:hypothetical protein